MKFSKNKLIIFTVIYLVLSTFFSALLFFNFKKESAIVGEISRNMIAIQDFNTLKSTLSPLLLLGISYIEISHKSRITFEIGEPANEIFLNSFNEVIEMGANASYTITVQFSIFKYLLTCILNIGLAYLLSLYYFTLKKTIDFNFYLADLAKKVAHDIRTPISTLNLISTKINDPEAKQLQLAVVNKINDIASDLLEQSKKGSMAIRNGQCLKSKGINGQFLSDLLLNLKKEYKFKAIAIKQQINFQNIEINLQKYSFDSELIKMIYPIINNLIQNSIEATTEKNKITVYSMLKNKKLYLVVEDNGKGIPAHILVKLGKSPLSYGKKLDSGNNQITSGNGIALYNAKSDLNYFNADLQIESKIDAGTKICIILPLVEHPHEAT